MRYYPVALNLANKHALVVGGGKVAEHKIKILLKFGACVKVVSPDLVPGLRRLAGAGKIRWINRLVRAADTKGADIVIAATSDTVINKRISRWSRSQRALVNVVDNPGLSDFISPAILTTAKAIIAVYTDGRDPALSRDLKDFLKKHWGLFLSCRER